MGNSAIRYTAGGEPGLGGKLAGKTIDFPTFSRIVLAKFAAPAQLLEALWMGFASDLPSKADMSDFAAALGVVLGSDRSLIMRFLFRVYDVKQSGFVEKARMERLLLLVYSQNAAFNGASKSNGNAITTKLGAWASISSAKVKTMLETLFHSSDRGILYPKDFETYVGPLEVLLSWVQLILVTFTEPPSAQLLAIERRFASALEVEEMMARYRQPRAACDQLRQIFYSKCNSSAKAELPFEAWVDWTSTSGFISPALAAVLFRIKIGTYKNVWRFADFAEFCMVFGAGSNVTKARAICSAFQSEFLSMRLGEAVASEGGGGSLSFGEATTDESLRPSTPPPSEPRGCHVLLAFQRHMRRMLYLLVHAYTPAQRQARKPFSANAQSPPRPVEPQPRTRSGSIEDAMQINHRPVRSLSLSSSRADFLGPNETESGTGIAHTPTRGGGNTTPSCPDDYYASLAELEPSMPQLPQSIIMALDLIESEGTFKLPINQEPSTSIPTPPRPGQDITAPLLPSNSLASVASIAGVALPIQPYVDLVASYAGNLPALRELSMTACCLFGIRPSTPGLEKEFVTGILLRRQEEAPQTRSDPYGPVHSEWCVISRSWWEKWRLFVGQQRPKPMHRTPKKGEARKTEVEIPPLSEPGDIDNWSILRKSGAKQLLQGTIVGHHLEVIPPALYRAVHLWYGGGPKITRRVILGPTGSTELELFPLCLKICTCDASGKARPVERELLFSKTALIADVALELCMFFGADKSKVRLWNYAMNMWHKQYILSPELTLSSAGIQDGQAILMEVSLPNGAWPRSQLHVALEAEEDKRKGEAAGVDGAASSSGGKPSTASEERVASGGKLIKPIRNAGTVGLENQGNTCYLNSSLQVLMHTQPLVEYFLSGTYLRHINPTNKFGHQGRLAASFGKLASELWSTEKQALTPKTFYAELTAARPQFAGHQQQDALDVLDEVLGCLSEDLNLVDDKPYTMQPDSDDRPDAELADIWWSNHFKRDVSIVQALFTGQFKTTTRCDCGYTSARFEVFTSLNLPIPEETHRTLVVHVFPRGVHWGVQCSVTIRRDGVLSDVVAAFLAKDYQPPLPGLGGNDIDESATNGTADSAAPQSAAETSAPLFLAAEVSSSRVLALSSLSRRLVSVKDTDNLFFFHVTTLPTVPSARHSVMFLSPSSLADARGSGSGSGSGSGTVSKTSLDEEDEDDDDDVSPTPIAREPSGPQLCRVVLLQRKVRLHDHAGIEYFKMEPFGLPLMEVLPVAQLSGRQLYQLVYQRVRGYLLQDMAASASSMVSQVAAAESVEGGFPTLAFPSMQAAESRRDGASGTSAAVNGVGNGTRSGAMQEGSDTDSLLGGPVSPFGFVLRRVVGGANGGCSCSSCPWLARCEGCVVPFDENRGSDSATVSSGGQVVSFRDGETLALDWHRIVWEELLDTSKAVCVKKHESVSNGAGASRSSAAPSTPLSSVLEKFTEEERLCDIVCPKCKSDANLHRRFELWRCPPFLVVTLKRFQFDRTVRRKLNNKIDFPISGLDLGSYLASSASQTVTATGSEANPRPVYDLYGTVHHVGMLGGGHYIAACCNSSALTEPVTDAAGLVKDKDTPSTSTSSSVSNTTSSASTDGASPKPMGQAWHIFNDGLVTKLQDVNEASAASAYLLFFRRRDCAAATHSELFPQGLSVDRLRDKDKVKDKDKEKEKNGKVLSGVGLDSSAPASAVSSSSGEAVAKTQGAGTLKERARQFATRRVKVFSEKTNTESGANDSDDEVATSTGGAGVGGGASGGSVTASTSRSKGGAASPSRQECVIN